jgi:hypothetical protein
VRGRGLPIAAALVLTILGGCTSSRSGHAGDEWLYGQWLTVCVSAPIVEREMTKRGSPPEKHVMVFRRDGGIRRYSPTRGWVRLLIEFRVEGDTVMMHPQTETKFLPLANRLDDGTLEILLPRHGRFIYRKLADGVNVDDLDLSGSPAVEKEEP